MGKGERRAAFFGVTADLLLHPQAGFKRAVELVGSEFMDRLDYYHRAWLPARVLVEDAIRRRFEVLPVLVLGGFKGWVEAWGKGRPGPLGVDLPTQLRAQLCAPFLSLHPYSHPLCTPVTPHIVTLLPTLHHHSPCTLNKWWCIPTAQGLIGRGGCAIQMVKSARRGEKLRRRAVLGHRAGLHVPPRSRIAFPLQVDTSGVMLELPQGGCPWKEHLFSLEKELALPNPLQLVLFPDRSGQWRVQSVPVGPRSFESR